MIVVVAQEFWGLLQVAYPELGGKPCPNVKMSSRMISTLGYAYFETNEIRLSTSLYAKNKELYHSDIIGHELAHIAAYILFGDYKHGKGWKDCMKAINLRPLVTYKEAVL